MPRSATRVAASAALFLFLCFAVSMAAYAQEPDPYKAAQRTQTAGKQLAAEGLSSIRGNRVLCQNGTAGDFPCSKTDLISLVSVSDLAAGLSAEAEETNDIWGWTDPDTGSEYVLIGMNSGTSFVNITDALNPVVVGFLETHTNPSIWRDIKVYNNHAYIVSEAPGHGMQVFDLTQLRTATNLPVQFQETAHYDEYGDAHNIVINEDTGFAYVVGAGGGGTTCGGGLHMVDLSTPAAPAFAGCYADVATGRFGTGYSHDAQCVVYNGPDAAYTGQEICIGSNETAISIADVTDKSNPVFVSRASYPQAAYIHQGWLSEDHRYFFQDDELDELNGKTDFTKTIVWDLEDLDDPVVLTEYLATTPVIDHNMYVKGNLLFQSNYTAGLRIIDISDPANMVEVAYFDTHPGGDFVNFNGSWSNYPFFESGVIAVSSSAEGLFLVESEVVDKTTAVENDELPVRLTLATPYPNPFDKASTLTLTLDKSQHVKVEAYDLLGRQVALLYDGIVPAQSPQTITFDAGNLPGGKYIVRATGQDYSVSRVVTLIR